MDMSRDPASKIVSRRSRPAKAPLSRDAIVSTALRILEKEGLSGLSLRRVAAALDTGAASLYVYVANLEELHSLMLDRALGAVSLPKFRSSRWQHRLKILLRSYFDALYKHPGLAQLAMSTIATGPNSLGIWETLLGLLKEGGVDDVQAAWGVDLLTLHVTAVAAEQSLRRENEPVLGRVENVLSAVSEQDFPLVFAFKKALLSGDGATRSEWALDLLLAGIVSAPPPVSKLRGGRHRK
jgi:AcrR family transcriptional regulator